MIGSPELRCDRGAECDLLIANPQSHVVLGIRGGAEVKKSLVELKRVLIRVPGPSFLSKLERALSLHKESDVLAEMRIGIEHVSLQTPIGPRGRRDFPCHIYGAIAEIGVVPTVEALPYLASQAHIPPTVVKLNVLNWIPEVPGPGNFSDVAPVLIVS